MWQPSRSQRAVIWTVALLVVLAWPPDQGRSLLLKTINRAADPAATLPSPPPPLPMGLDDDGDAVSAHDAQEAEYYRHYTSSNLARWRMRLKESGEPLDPGTERQLLVGLVVVSALLVWRLNPVRADT